MGCQVPVKTTVNKWYPSKKEFPDEHQFQAMHQIVDMIYGLQGRQSQLESDQRDQEGRLRDHHARILRTEGAGGPSTTRIAGLFVKATTPPANSDTIRYNSKTGQWEFGA